MISNADCLQSNTVTSSPFHITVADTLKPDLQITGETTVRNGSFTQISSLLTNITVNSGYQWQDSTYQHGWLNIPNATAATLMYPAAASGDRLRCILNFNQPCNPNHTTISNNLVFIVDKDDNNSAGGIHGIKYYPNPVTHFLNVDSLHTEDMWQSIQVVSMSGAIIQTSSILPNQNRVSLDLSSLETGAYLVILRGTKYKPVYLKFIKR